MRFKRLITMTSLSLLMAAAAPIMTTSHPAEAATFSTQEVNRIRQIQNEYASLDKTPYTSANLYQTAPNLTTTFSPGVLSSAYQTAQLNYINYYRQLFGLPAISANQSDNSDAQLTASVMAAIQADPFTDQHGLPSEKQPTANPKINDRDWNTAKIISASANLNFNVTNESAGDVITDLLTDSYNLTGMDTGHRAWILSTRLKTTGLGAAYGQNGYRYSVMRVVYPLDSFGAAQKQTVAYPSEGVFPIELLQGTNIAWSLYLSDTRVAGTPSITVTDLDTGQTSAATNVSNYSQDGYGNFKTILTYYPGNIRLVSGHQYRISVNGVTTYSFKLFNQIAANQPALQTQDTTSGKSASGTTPSKAPKDEISNQTTDTSASSSHVKIESALLKQAEAISDQLLQQRPLNSRVFGRSYQDGDHFYNLGRYQWFRDFFEVSNPKIEAGILDTSENVFDHQIYTSPYPELQKSTMTFLRPNGEYAYGQKIKIQKTVWYYLGPQMWVKAAQQF